jgi:glycosyltransferase involved in cell wall biosynthesis
VLKILDSPIELTVLMPCLNESETLLACIEEAAAAITKLGISAEILIADNGSTDGSQEIARQAGAKIVDVPEKGYGNALIGGIKAARGKYILMGDADQSYNFGELPLFLSKLREGCELVMGCRLPKGGGTIEKGAMPWKHRWIGNPILSSLGKLLFRSRIDDFHCGLRAFRKDSIIKLELACPGMEFASEMVVKATLSKLKVGQVPVTLRPDGRSRLPHLRSWRDGWRHLRFMLLFSPNWLFIIPGLILLVAGGTGFSILLPRPLNLGQITLDLNSLVGSSTIFIAGAQVVSFGILVKVYAVTNGLLPGHKRWLTLARSNVVDLCIAAGVAVLLLGVGNLVHAFLIWLEVDFSELDTQASMRKVILSVTSIALGLQLMFTSFAVAMLGTRQ